MSAAATRGPVAPPVARVTGSRPASSILRLVAFAALAVFATGHWATLVKGPPAAGLAGAVLAAVAIGAALIALARVPLPHGAANVAAVAITLAGVALALVATGLPAELLEPARWDELATTLDRGLAGLRTVAWPYAGPDESVRLVIVLGAPLLLAAGAALTFWPIRRGAGILQALGLVALLMLYGLAVTEHDPGEPLLRGVILLGLIGAWLWLPRLERRDAVPALALVLAACALSLPPAARLDDHDALIDYRAWSLFGGKDVTFDWNHSYGPLDWPRDGTTLLNVRAGRPHYWKAQTLDRFDGLRWLRSSASEGTRPTAELPSRVDPRWDERLRVTVRALRTDFVVAAGTPYSVTGAGEAVSSSADGTVRRLEEPLRRGDSYIVRTYAPKPNAREMRSAADRYAPDLRQYTAISLPARGADALDRAPRMGAGAERPDPRNLVEIPLRGGLLGGTPGAVSRLSRSPYRRTFGLARRLVLGAPTVYDIAKRIERHLERSYAYSERPPSREYPLDAFLFEDRIGYCQQFSGAMALMLRMVGVPARVVSGFSPGSLNRDTREYRVRDLDAHSWVEVYFTGIGWVTFDPTPAGAPADRPGGESNPSRATGNSAGSISSDSRGAPGGDRPAQPAVDGAGEKGGLPAWAVMAALAMLSLVAAAGVALRRRGRRTPMAVADASLAELRRALPRLGWELTATTTLLQLERRLARAGGPRAARYVSRLRAGRFATGGARPLGAGERRALRRELTAGRGLVSRLRGFLALPPAGPFTRP